MSDRPDPLRDKLPDVSPEEAGPELLQTAVHASYRALVAATETTEAAAQLWARVNKDKRWARRRLRQSGVCILVLAGWIAVNQVRAVFIPIAPTTDDGITQAVIGQLAKGDH